MLFRSGKRALNVFSDLSAVLFGAAVVRFFNREGSPPFIDACVQLEKLERIINFFREEGLMYVACAGSSRTFEEEMIFQLDQIPALKVRSSGDRNSSDEDRSGWGPYNFFEVLENGGYSRGIRLHVVRCEPYRHILALHSSTSVYITLKR